MFLEWGVISVSQPRPPNQLTLAQPPPPKHNPKHHTPTPSATPSSSLDPPPPASQAHSQSLFQCNDVGGYRAEFEGKTHPPSAAAAEKTGRKSASPNIIAEKVVLSANSTAHAQSVVAHSMDTPSMSNPQSFQSQRGVAPAASQRGVASTTSGGGGGQKTYASAFSNVVGGQGMVGVAPAAGGVSGGSGMLGTGTPTSLSSALTMVSNDQDDSVFSPSSVDDERMKIIEQVGEQ